MLPYFVKTGRERNLCKCAGWSVLGVEVTNHQRPTGSDRLRLLGSQTQDRGAQAYSPEEIELLVSERYDSGLLDDSKRQMLRNTLRFRELTAHQVMIHRTKLAAAPKDSSVQYLMDKAVESGYSRIPLYNESIDDIVGFVHVKDLLHLYVQGEEDSRQIVRDVIYVSETLPATDVWQKLSSSK